jgi:hypothetical protein
LGGRLDVANIHFAEFLDVADHLAKLSAELLFFLGRQADSREVRDILHVDGCVWHGAEGRGRAGMFKAEIVVSGTCNRQFALARSGDKSG